MPRSNQTKAKKTAQSANRFNAPRRRNSELEAAAALAEGFHGRPARKVREVKELTRERVDLADLGPLVEIAFAFDNGKIGEINFNKVRLAASADGGQLYIVGGDQSLDLEAMGLDKWMPKDHLRIGHVVSLTYHGSKRFHKFEPSQYEHEMGEEGGSLPTLGYDTLNRRLYLLGGSYRVEGEWIRN